MEIDLELINTYDLRADEYILLELMRRKSYNKLRTYFSDRSYLQTCLDKLEERGFVLLIKYGIKGLPQDYDIIKLPVFDSKVIDKMFEELLENYPKHIIRPNGVKEYLRTNTSKAKEIYKSIIKGSKDKHQLVIECLKYQLALYVRTGKMPYMRKMINWLANHEWEEFKDFVLKNSDIEEDNDNQNYGTDIL